MTLTGGKMKISFNTIYPILVEGSVRKVQAETQEKLADI